MVCQNCFEENTKSAEICVSCGMLLTNDQIIMPDAVVGKKTEYASFWGRFAASIIDGLIVGIPITIISIVIFGNMSGGESEYTPLQLGLQLFSGLIGWLYFALMESSSKQATFGKQALGFIVTDEAGQRLSFWRATGRHFGKIISGITLYIGYIMAGFTERKQALHDMMASTLVVKKSRY